MLKRNIDRFYYFLLLVSLQSAYATIKILSALTFLFPKTKKGDIIFYPHEQVGSDGYTKRFEQYFPFFQKDNISYYVCNLYPDSYIKGCLSGTKFQQYYLYHLIIWKRIQQVMKARHYKAAFIHRRLFACYPDSKYAYLERLLRKLNDNITVDYWDSVWLNNPSLYQDIILHVDKISVVNNYVYNYFKNATVPKYIFPIAVNTTDYIVKQDYCIEKEIKLFWTGLSGNLPQVLGLSAILQKLSKQYDISLVLVCSVSIQIDGVKVVHFKWQRDTFFEILRTCDIGLYPCENNEEGRGKMAMKVVEYMACGLPCIGNHVGLTPYAKNGENILIASSEEEWYNNIETLINNKSLRERIGKNGRKTIEDFHEVEKSYKSYKSIILSA